VREMLKANRSSAAEVSSGQSFRRCAKSRRWSRTVTDGSRGERLRAGRKRCCPLTAVRCGVDAWEEGEMGRRCSPSEAMNAMAGSVDWMVTVTEPLPDCPSVEAGWERIATQSAWGEWRSESKMRGRDVITTVVAPATEPLRAGDEYVVKVGRWMKIRCRVLESSSPGAATGESGEMVFDATGTALGGMVRARFRFTVFGQAGGSVMARGPRARSLFLVFLTRDQSALLSR
jgi:hypothetical protein